MTHAMELLLIHGAGSGPWVFEGWEGDLPGLLVRTVDLHDGLDVSSASMEAYSDRVVAAARRARGPLVLCGWSMGGLVALMAARPSGAAAAVLIEPSPPGEAQGFDPSVRPVTGTFDPESVYGPFPAGIRARPESSLARAQRKAGISVPSVPCPVLVISGDEFREERGERVASLYDAEHRHFAGLDHWGLLKSRSVREAIASFVESSIGRPLI